MNNTLLQPAKEYVSCADTAVELRKALKAAFPGIGGFDGTDQLIFEEWRALNQNGIVPQKPRRHEVTSRIST